MSTETITPVSYTLATDRLTVFGKGIKERKCKLLLNVLIFLKLRSLKLTIKMSEKTERRFGVILAPLSSKECNRKDNLYIK